MEPPSSINADTGKQTGQRSDDPLSCMLYDGMNDAEDSVLSNDTIYFTISSYDESSYGRTCVCACLPARKAAWVYLGTLPLMES